jgi:hypothetical protein
VLFWTRYAVSSDTSLFIGRVSMHERWASQLRHLTSPASQPTKTNDREESKERDDSENERT